MSNRPTKAAMADPRHGFVAFDPYEQKDASEQTFLAVLGEVVDLVESAGIEHLVIGGIGSTAQGRYRLTHDVDLFVRQRDADRLLELLAAHGYETQATDPNWIYKGFKDGVIVDIIFKAQGGLFLDADMSAHAVQCDFNGIDLRVASREDLIVMKAITSDEDSPRHWFDSLALIAAGELDWNYLLERARKGPRRVLSLVLYAQADDLPIPSDVVPALYALIDGSHGVSSRSAQGELFEHHQNRRD